MNSKTWKNLGGDIGPHLKSDLDRLLESKQYYHYVKEHRQSGVFPDAIGQKEIVYNLYGDLDNNALLATMSVDGATYYGRIHSPVVYPAMMDRIFGMDQDDATTFNWMTDMMCFVYVEGKTVQWTLDKWDKDWNSRHPDKPVENKTQ